MIRSALKEAEKSDIMRARMGATITKGKRILSTGFNEIRGYKNCPVPRRWENSLHCEQAAILKLLNHGRQHELIGATIHVSRIKRDGKPGMAKPCPTCQELIMAVGIKKVKYTTETGTEEYKNTGFRS